MRRVADARLPGQSVVDTFAQRILLLEQELCVRFEPALDPGALRRDGSGKCLVVDREWEMAIHNGHLRVPRTQYTERLVQAPTERALEVRELYESDRGVGSPQHRALTGEAMDTWQNSGRERVRCHVGRPEPMAHERGGPDEAGETEDCETPIEEPRPLMS